MNTKVNGESPIFENRTFQFAFLISFAVHAAIIVQNPGYLFLTTPQKGQKVEINYIKQVKLPKEENPAAGRLNRLRGEPLLKLPSKISMESRNPPPFIDANDLPRQDNKQAMRTEVPFEKPALIKPDIIAIKKKITLPPVDMAKINNPSYINYYQLVREKIRRAAYQNYNRNETGEVYITFVISDDGYLKDVRLVEEKSSSSDYLRAAALSSVKIASPFPNFPKELDYPQLSFNVVISFEIE